MNQHQTQNSTYNRFGNYVANATNKLKNKTLIAVFALIMLQLADVVITLMALSLQVAREGNPAFENAPMYYFLIGKIVAISLMLLGYAYTEKTKSFQFTFSAILLVFITVYIVVVVNNLLVLFGGI